MIRKYTKNDKEELLRIFELNTPKFFDTSEINHFDKYLETDGDNYFVIENEMKIVGGAGIQITNNNSVGHITWIFIHPNHSGKGFGKQTVEHCLTELKKIPSMKKVNVTTSQMAYKFFEKFNFTVVKTEKDYWGKELDLYTMELRIRK